MMIIGILRPFVLCCVFILVLTGCQTIKTSIGKGAIKKELKSPIFTSQFTGMVLFDPESKEYLYDTNGDLYFTPASNTKILTALACLETFNDSIPSFSYHELADTIYLEPLGDPTVLHPDFPHQPVIHKLRDKTVQIRFPDAPLTPFGPGWAWDDYQFSFQPQIAWFPLYANEVRIYKEDTLKVIPDFFADYINVLTGEKPGNFIYREQKFNLFHIWMESDTSTFERKIPFDYSEELVLELLSDTLNKPVRHVNNLNSGLYGTLYNQATLPVLALMMLRSDNFLAEQLLVTAARKSGYKNMQAYRNYLLSKWQFLPAAIQWVDGSGLSRYNLVTPKVLVAVLDRIYQTQDWRTIATIFPTGGYSGTIKDWYSGYPPYVFAKTGTLSNNHSLSGFIKTNSGKTLIFSIMNNHYTRPVDEVKKEMQTLLETIRRRY